MTSVFHPEAGERLILGAPFSGELILKTASPSPAHREAAGGASTGGVIVGLQTLPRGSACPALRHPTADMVCFIHKGQGRVTVDGQSKTVVPGVTVVLPRGVWYELRNTGTGVLHVVWAFPSAAFADFFREVSRAGGTVEPATLHTIAQRHGFEVRLGTPAPSPARPAHRQVTVGTSTPSAAAPSEGRRPRRRRGRRGGRGHRPASATSAAVAPASAPAPPPAAGTPPPASPPSPQRSPRQAPRADRPRRGNFRRGGRGFKEVFMNGRWVRVTGEGPMIDSGE